MKSKHAKTCGSTPELKKGTRLLNAGGGCRERIVVHPQLIFSEIVEVVNGCFQQSDVVIGSPHFGATNQGRVRIYLKADSIIASFNCSDESCSHASKGVKYL